MENYFLLVVLLMFSIAAGAKSKQQCPREWKSYGGSCYLFVLHTHQVRPMTWKDARNNCSRLGGDLVSITSSSEADFIHKQTKRLGLSLWIGLYKKNKTKDPKKGWAWSDGSKLKNPRWKKNEPNNADQNENCVELKARSNEWNDNNCNKRFSSICERKKDVDECVSGSHDCGVGSRCINNIGSFSCHCRTGFTGNGTHCQDTDECKTGKNVCHEKARCSNNDGSFSCICKNGFSGDGKYCKDIDECEVGGYCPKEASCTNTIGSFSCSCESGFTMDGSACQGRRSSNFKSTDSNKIVFIVPLAVLSAFLMLTIAFVAIRKNTQCCEKRSQQMSNDVTGGENGAVELGACAVDGSVVESNYETLDTIYERPVNYYQSLKNKSSNKEKETEMNDDCYDNQNAELYNSSSQPEVDYVIPVSCENGENCPEAPPNT